MHSRFGRQCDDKMTSFKGLPFINLSLLDKKFSGDIHLIMHQGLGDTLNGLGIYRALTLRLPAARFIVHANRTWGSVIRLRERDEVRLFSQGVDILSPHIKFIDVYKELLKSVQSEIKSSPRKSYCALGPFRTSDQYASGESLFENAARMVCMQDPIRPYIHVYDEEVEMAVNFLKSHHLVEGAYCIMAPHTWPEKRWKTEEFELLGNRLLKIYGMRTLVVGHKELPPLKIPGSVESFGLNLQVVAALIARSAIFIGLDSGPAHLTAAFDIPLVVLYFQTDKVPFDIRPLTPYAQLVVGSLFGEKDENIGKTVFELVGDCVKKTLSSNILCPACQRTMDYVIEADHQKTKRICVCGVRKWEMRNKKFIPVTFEKREASEENDQKICHMPENDDQVENFKNWLKSTKPSKLKIRFSWPETNPPQESIHWSLDGILQFFEKEEIPVTDLILKDDILKLSFGRKRTIFSGISVPWAGKMVRMPSVKFYQQYFQWQAWASSYQWRRMSQFAREEKNFYDALRLSWVTLRFDKCSETVRFFLQNILGFFLRR